MGWWWRSPEGGDGGGNESHLGGQVTSHISFCLGLNVVLWDGSKALLCVNASSS